MLLEAGVTLYFHSYLTGCRTEEGRISHVVIENKNGAEALVARYFIDATGDADLALRAGVPMQPASTTLQPASLIFMLGGVDTDALPMLRHSRQGVSTTTTSPSARRSKRCASGRRYPSSAGRGTAAC